jgi:hypothetical protein
MGAAMQRLDELSRSAKFAKYVKNVRVEDDCVKIDAALPVLATSDREMERKADVWPRGETHIVNAEAGAAKLTTIRDNRESCKTISTVAVTTLARDMLIDADLAITFFCVQSRWTSITQAVFHFDPQYHGKSAGFSRLRKVHVPIHATTPEFWSDAVFRHAPQLQDLDLSIVNDTFSPKIIPTS